MASFTQWLVLAGSRSVVRRSARVAFVVGSLLAAINHGDQLLRGALTSTELLKIGLSYCVPYCVATWSATGALLAHTTGESR